MRPNLLCLCRCPPPPRPRAQHSHFIPPCPLPPCQGRCVTGTTPLPCTGRLTCRARPKTQVWHGCTWALSLSHALSVCLWTLRTHNTDTPFPPPPNSSRNALRAPVALSSTTTRAAGPASLGRVGAPHDRLPTSAPARPPPQPLAAGAAGAGRRPAAGEPVGAAAALHARRAVAPRLAPARGRPAPRPQRRVPRAGPLGLGARRPGPRAAGDRGARGGPFGGGGAAPQRCGLRRARRPRQGPERALGRRREVSAAGGGGGGPQVRASAAVLWAWSRARARVPVRACGRACRRGSWCPTAGTQRRSALQLHRSATGRCLELQDPCRCPMPSVAAHWCSVFSAPALALC